MPREILFRAKRIDNERWVEGMPINTHIGTFIAYEENPHYCAQYRYMEIDELCKVHEKTICQYTGLLDMTEEKIWENDIVLVDDEYCKVAWDEDDAKFVLESNGDYMDDLGNYWGHKREVVGNIFDNPELLQEE